jgi:uncharacterized membrane-anchored protein YjiN (DUF445 family)
MEKTYRVGSLMNEETINVKISGSEVYKAVSNYLKNSEKLQETIEKNVAKVLGEPTFIWKMEDQIMRTLLAMFEKNEIKNAVKSAVLKELEKKLSTAAKAEAFSAFERKLSELSKEDLMKMVMK